jgi:sugar-phosphatase
MPGTLSSTTPSAEQPQGVERHVVEVRQVLDTPFDAVLFDMDGTLIDSTPAVRRSWIAWGAERGLDPSFREGGHGQPARDIISSLVPAGERDAAFARIEEIEIAEVDGITVLPGVAEALHAIPEARKAIVTSCTKPLADARIAASGVIAPSVVVTFDDVTQGKPHPEPFLTGAKRLGFDPQRCLVVEDATAGLVAGRAAGCATLAVAGTHKADDLDADLVVSGLDELSFAMTPDGIVVSVRA